MHAFTLICFGALLAALVSCGPKRPIDEHGRVIAGPLVLLVKQPASGTIRIADVFPAGAPAPTFDVFDDDHQAVGRFVVSRFESTEVGAQITRSDDITRTEHLRVNNQGELALTSVLDHKEDAISHFNPPLLVMPARLEANVTQRHTAAMRVLDAEQPSRVRESGRARREITYTANQRIRTPHGEFDAKRIESRFIADLRLASVDELTVMFIVPGYGIMAEHSREHVKVLGAFGNTTTRTLIRSIK